MKKSYIKYSFAALIGLMSCTNLDIQPKTQAVGDLALETPESYRAFITRVYAGLAVSGQEGPAGNPDIKDLDEGFSNYIRLYFNVQELPTEEAIISWNDGTLQNFHVHSWTQQNEFLSAMYNRIYFQISMANAFLRETTEEKLSKKFLSQKLRNDIKQYRAEARFLRALAYTHGVDLFGNIPIVTEAKAIGSAAPDQNTRAEVFNFIEQELLEIEPELGAPGFEYARVDKAVAWTLLAKLYLNAEIYAGTDRYDDCITYCEKVINEGGYQLAENYQDNFLADNNTSPEIIFPVTFDGLYTQTYGGTTYLIYASLGGTAANASDADNILADMGVTGGWGGLRITSNLVDLFPDETGTIDKRVTWYTIDQTKTIASVSDFSNGYMATKFRNVTKEGASGKNAAFPDTDFPMFRLADVYLMHAEAVLREGSGNTLDPLDLVNEIRVRAYGNSSPDAIIDDSEFDLEFILDERGRELYWEAQRRTDLVRFNQFTENGVWPWKGGVAAGQTTEKYRDLYPIPSTERIANPKLDQNDGYE